MSSLASSPQHNSKSSNRHSSSSLSSFTPPNQQARQVQLNQQSQAELSATPQSLGMHSNEQWRE
jgi:hypothetical protein